MCKEHFEWQDEYIAMCESESGVNAVGEYIKNQETHHAKKHLEEYDEFINKYGFVLARGYSPFYFLFYNLPPEGRGNS